MAKMCPGVTVLEDLLLPRLAEAVVELRLSHARLRSTLIFGVL